MGLSIFDRIKQGGDRLLGVPPQTGLLSPQDIDAARKRGLLTLGTTLLQAGGARRDQPGTLANLGAAIEAAQGAGLQGIAEGDALQARQREEETTQRRDQLMTAFAQSESPTALMDLFEGLIQVGDTESARTVAEVLKSLGGGGGTRGVVVSTDGRKKLIDPTTGDVIRDLGPDAGDPDNRDFQNSNALFGKFLQVTSVEADKALMFESMKEGRDSNSPAGDIRLVFAFMKMIDPRSTVRESEQAQARNAAGVPVRIRNLWNNLLAGTTLSDSQRADILQQGENEARAASRSLNRKIKTFSSRAEQFGLSPSFVTEDFFAGLFDDDERPPARESAEDDLDKALDAVREGRNR